MFFSRKTYKFKEGLSLRLKTLIKELKETLKCYGNLTICTADEDNSITNIVYLPTVCSVKDKEVVENYISPTHLCLNMPPKAITIDEVIKELTSIKSKYGNVPVCYESSEPAEKFNTFTPLQDTLRIGVINLGVDNNKENNIHLCIN
jgi:hypothetical protein